MTRANKTGPFSFDVSKYPSLPRLKGLFIAGTDTDVGKTLIAGAIARELRGRGMRVEVMKPAASGCRHTSAGLISSDAEFLAACAESRRTLADIAPVRFSAALSPNVAAQREHRQIDLAAIFDSYARLEGTCDCVIIEGVGGLLCPISDDFWVIHLAKMMQLPLVVVARPGLGTINHTLLTLHAATSAGLDVAGVVVNRYQIEPATHQSLSRGEPSVRGDAELAMFTNPQQIAKLGKVDVLVIAPDEPENSVERVTIGPDTSYAISQVDWVSLMG